MALEDQVQEDTQALSKDEKDDLRIAVGITQDLIDDGGWEVVERAISTSKDPGQVVGQFLMQLAGELTKNLPQGVTLSPRIWLANDGVLEQVSDYLQEEYDVDSEVMDRAEMFVASAIQAQAQQEQQQAPAVGGM